MRASVYDTVKELACAVLPALLFFRVVAERRCMMSALRGPGGPEEDDSLSFHCSVLFERVQRCKSRSVISLSSEIA